MASANSLRREVNARNLLRGAKLAHELTSGAAPCVIYQEDESGAHGNFLAASYRRIQADDGWRKRLAKSYTSGARVPRSADRWRGELECASSSDALLMNVFCYPRVTWRLALCGLLGVERGLRPEFGVRASLAMRHSEIDRTECDMRLGSLLIEAKLTESGFGTASRERLLRYVAVDEIFNVDELPWNGERLQGYQIARGVLAAQATDASFLLLCDSRRADLIELWFRVLRSVKSYELRSRMALVSWQELAGTMPGHVQTFLVEKYGIAAA